MKTFKIISIFSEVFIRNDVLVGNLGVGIIKKSFNKLWNLDLIDLKKYNRIDDRIAGGGPGMLIKPEIMFDCLKEIKSKNIYFTSPRGERFSQNTAKRILNEENVVFVCGRYEGIDQRIIDYFQMKEISIGDYILCGGEVAVQVILESVIRLIPGVLNNHQSIEEESFSNILLENDQFTKPNSWLNMSIPEVLLSGNHKDKNLWKLKNSLQKTFNNRKDLYDSFVEFVLLLIIIRIFNNKRLILNFS
jgi:tRNA (guanine37-N1)-methyltransferase